MAWDDNDWDKKEKERKGAAELTGGGFGMGVDRAAAGSGDSRVSGPRPALHAAPAAHPSPWGEAGQNAGRNTSHQTRLKGVAQHWIPDRGFGFIKPPRGGGDNVFCHFSAITDGDVLRKGDPIEYELEFDYRTGKYRAVNVTGGRRDGLAEQSELTADEVQQVTFAAGFTLISWNIEGLADDEIILRTQVAMSELLAQGPTLICLQEVVPETIETIQVMLGGRYLDVDSTGAEAHDGDYFTKIFVLRASGLTVCAASRVPFNSSRQGRDLLLVTLEHKGKRVCVATTHLESLAQNVDLRHRQLIYSLQQIEAHSVQQGADLFLLVGDLNLTRRDNESLLREITQGWVDADRRPTWDARSNKRVRNMLDALDDANGVERRISNVETHHRFDRCYFKIGSQAAGVGWKFRAASLVGTNTSALLEQSDDEHTRSGHVSDHYGLRLVWEHPSAFGNFPSDYDCQDVDVGCASGEILQEEYDAEMERLQGKKTPSGAGDDATKEDGYVPPHLRNREAPKEEIQQLEQRATVRVIDVSKDATRDDMHELFRPFGPIARVSVPQDRATGKGRGFAFIDFYNHADAAKAIEAINGTKFNSHILNVDWARPSVC
jgi:cold shock CspA family protein/endonuclease/exonuclease/phosphatase family metal-dependent hydrolase